MNMRPEAMKNWCSSCLETKRKSSTAGNRHQTGNWIWSPFYLSINIRKLKWRDLSLEPWVSKITVLFCASGAFASGLAEGTIEDVLQPISAIRLVFQSDADVWAILSEVCSARCMCFFFHLGWTNLAHSPVLVSQISIKIWWHLWNPLAGQSLQGCFIWAPGQTILGNETWFNLSSCLLTFAGESWGKLTVPLAWMSY